MRTLVRSFSGLALMVGFVVGVASVAGCGGAGSDVGVPPQRDLGPFIIQQPSGSGDMATSMPPASGEDMTMPNPPPSPQGDMAMPTSGCGTIDANGICTGSTLEYCNSSNELVTKDCSSSGKVCSVSSSGYANCTTN